MIGEDAVRVIVVEDEPELRDNLVIGLSAHGFEVRGAGNATSLATVMEEVPIDIVVLDLGLPGEDGIEIARRLQKRAELGIIMVTARGMLEDRIEGFESGADNYFVKPVDIAELAATIRNLKRRLINPPANKWRLAPTSSILTTPHGTQIPLTAQECRLLELLLARRGVNVTRLEIFDTLGLPDDIYSNPRVEVLISRLRAKVLKADPDHPLPLRARHNIGYLFLAEE